jgi:hypothetical protein
MILLTVLSYSAIIETWKYSKLEYIDFQNEFLFSLFGVDVHLLAIYVYYKVKKTSMDITLYRHK